MVRSSFPPAWLALILFTACVPLRPQADIADPPNAKAVPQHTASTPFPPAAGPLEIARSIQLRSSDQITEHDRLLEADAESSIAERAGYADIAFNQGKWSYTQLVCPALPNHLFLRFTRNNGVGDVSVFSASIPRNGEGHIRIIPILRRSYSLFSPAPINALTIAAFNRIRIEDKSDAAPGWLGTGLCYAALAGANPMAASGGTIIGQKNFPAASAPILEISPDGGAVIHFTDVSATPRPMQWSLIFNGKGRLLKAAHSAALMDAEKAVPADDAAQKAKPVPAS
jgi:hypothetical protein